MKMKYVTLLREGDVDYDIYYDKKSDKYYKVNGEEKIELDGETLLSAQVANDCLRKIVRARRVKKAKRVGRLLTLLLMSGLAVGAVVKSNEAEINYVMEEQSPVQDYVFLLTFAKQNASISESTLNELMPYLDCLGELGIDELEIVAIAHRLEHRDFNGVDALNVIHQAMNLDDNGFLAKEMYYYIHEKDHDYVHGLIANLFLSDHDMVVKLFEGKSLEDVVKDKFGIKFDFANLTDNDIDVLEAINEKIASVALGLDFGDGIALNNNIFERFIRIRCNTFNLYIEVKDGALEDRTEMVYYSKLSDLIINKGEYIDYQDPECRFLVYLYANALLNGNYGNLDITTAQFLFEATKNAGSGINSTVVVQAELYTFLSGPHRFDYSYLPLFYQLAYYVEDALPILQEVNLCLKEEVEAGNLSQESYDEFIETVIAILSVKEGDYLHKFVDASIKGKSIDGFKLQLVQNYQTV